MKQDIIDRESIERLVNAFYDKVKTDAEIGYLFTDVANVNWERHLPIMYDFWENVLFSTGNYSGNPMLSHKELHAKSPMNAAHFIHWVSLFHATTDELFSGPKADEIKQRAQYIAAALMHKTVSS